MTTILIEPNTTPTGFGLKQRGNGMLRPLSPCCGRSMTWNAHHSELTCNGGCGGTYQASEAELVATLGNDVDPTCIENGTLQRWVARVLGVAEADVDVQVHP